MAEYVQLTQLDGTDVQINPEEVFSLTPVPTTLLPPAIPAGTYIADEDGSRVAVVGTVLATATALAAAVASTAPRALFDAAGNLLAQNGVSGAAHVIGSGIYVVALSGGLLLQNEPLACTPTGAGVAAGVSCLADWTAVDEVTVSIFDVSAAAGIPIDSGFSIVITPV